MAALAKHVVSVIGASAASVGMYVLGDVWVTTFVGTMVCVVISSVTGTLVGALIFTHMKGQ